MKKNLKKVYEEWRELNAELEAEGERVSNDCGEEVVRIDFSQFAGLETVISFEEMWELEKEYNK